MNKSKIGAKAGGGARGGAKKDDVLSPARGAAMGAEAGAEAGATAAASSAPHADSDDSDDEATKRAKRERALAKVKAAMAVAPAASADDDETLLGKGAPTVAKAQEAGPPVIAATRVAPLSPLPPQPPMPSFSRVGGVGGRGSVTSADAGTPFSLGAEGEGGGRGSVTSVDAGDVSFSSFDSVATDASSVLLAASERDTTRSVSSKSAAPPPGGSSVALSVAVPGAPPKSSKPAGPKPTAPKPSGPRPTARIDAHGADAWRPTPDAVIVPLPAPAAQPTGPPLSLAALEACAAVRSATSKGGELDYAPLLAAVSAVSLEVQASPRARADALAALGAAEGAFVATAEAALRVNDFVRVLETDAQIFKTLQPWEQLARLRKLRLVLVDEF